MQIKTAMRNIIQGKIGRWQNVNGVDFFIDVLTNKVILPFTLSGQKFDTIDINSLEHPSPNPQKIQIIQALIIANTVGYPRLQEYLTNLANIFKLGTEFQAEQEQFEKLNTFLHSYTPVDSSMRDFLKKYLATNQDTLNQLQQLVAADNPENKPVSNVPKEKKENPLNVKKFGIYRFPFLSQDKLQFGEVENYKNIPQVWNYSGTHYKLWANIDGIPFLVNGYKDDEYSCVNRVLASQIGKLLGLHCEEVFFGTYHGKAVTLTAFTEAVTLFENQMFEIYELDSLNYIYQSEQKRAFYFLIQNWKGYVKTSKGIVERFTEHFVNEDGSVFLSNHQDAMFATPQLMPLNIMVPLEINKINYRAIKDMVARVGEKDLADIVFSSIPDELIELHDEKAKEKNDLDFAKKKACFDSNWQNLLISIQEFEAFPRGLNG